MSNCPFCDELERAFQYIKTYKYCTRIVTHCGSALRIVPWKWRTYALCYIAMNSPNHGDIVLQYVPRNIITSDLCFMSARVNPDALALRHVPDELMTEQMCLTAVRQNSMALQFVPEHMKTEEMCLDAVRVHDHLLDYVPGHIKTFEFCRAVGPSKYLPEDAQEFLWICINISGTFEEVCSALANRKTYEMCLNAVRECDVFLRHVIPNEPKMKKKYLEMVNGDGATLEQVPDHLKTNEMCLAAVRQNSVALQFVPEHLKTEELCLESLYQFQHMKEYSVFKEQWDYIGSYFNGLTEILTTTKHILPHIPDHLRTEEFYLKAIKRDVAARVCIPDHLKTKEFYLKAIEIKSVVLMHVPNHLLNFEFYLAAVNRNGLALEYVPEFEKTRNYIAIQQNAIGQNPRALRYASMGVHREHFISLCRAAIIRDSSTELYVPAEFRQELGLK